MSKRNIDDEPKKAIKGLIEKRNSNKSHNGKKKYNFEISKKLYELKVRGYSLTDLGRIYGCSAVYVSKLLKKFEDENQAYIKEIKNFYMDENDKKLVNLAIKTRREALVSTSFILNSEIERLTKKVVDGEELTTKELSFVMRYDENNIKFQLKEMDILNNREMETATLEELQNSLDAVFNNIKFQEATVIDVEGQEIDEQ